MAFRSQLFQQAEKAPFMKGMKTLVGVEFGEMAAGLFPLGAARGPRDHIGATEQNLHEITTMSAAAFRELAARRDIDRALPRLVAAATLMESFGYSEILLTERELGAGLIIEAGPRRMRSAGWLADQAAIGLRHQFASNQIPNTG